MVRTSAAVLLVCAVLATPACTRTSGGVPVAGDDTQSGGAVPSTQGAPCAPATMPPVRVVAEVSDPSAPTATIGVPEGWSMSSGGGDPEGARLEGPDGMEAVVTIAPTVLDPESAFRDWVDFLTEDATVSTVSTLPGDLCGYSGQELMGNLADDTQSVEYRDRLVYVGTPGQAYLIVVHAEAPVGTPGFDEAATLVTDDFEIGLP